MPITIPQGVKVQAEAHTIAVEGPKGKLNMAVPPLLTVRVEGSTVVVERTGDEPSARAQHGLYRALLANMVHGVTNGFSKELEIIGVGYRAQMAGKQLALNVGFSHQVLVDLPAGIAVEIPKPTALIVRGADKQLVGQFAASLRRVAPPEPYKGKGIRYAGEVVRHKAGKAATGSGAKSAG